MTRLFVLARHGESVLNAERRVNGDPSLQAGLTERGREEARALAVQLAGLPLDLCVHTRFPRTLETAQLVLSDRDVPLRVEPLLDDVDVGDLDGAPIDEYRAIKRGLGRTRPFPGGESLDDAARRYARGFLRLLHSGADAVLVVCHEIPVRYALNGAAGAAELDGPVHDIGNAAPFLFDEAALARAVERIERLAGVQG